MKKKTAPRRSMFPKEFLVDMNATKAATRCGYSKKTAGSQGQRLLKNVEIQKAIRKLMNERGDRLEITADKWLRELAIIGFSDLNNYITIEDGGAIIAKKFDEMPKGTSRALEAIEENRTIMEKPGDKRAKSETILVNSKIKFKLHDKLGALEKIGKHLGFLTNDFKGDLTVRARLSIDALKKSAKGYKDANG